MAPRTLKFTDAQIKVLILILGVDLDALGLEQKDQTTARALLKKLKEDAWTGR